MIVYVVFSLGDVWDEEYEILEKIFNTKESAKEYVDEQTCPFNYKIEKWEVIK